MEKYTLHRKSSSNGFHYTVTDEAGKVISHKDSKRSYIACTCNAEFFFRSLNDINKGDHGRTLNIYKDFSRTTQFSSDYVKDRIRQLSSIAYLTI